jgi:O-succinylbenzoic acid--CoA ligase
MIPTGGSSGQVRFAVHTLETLTAAVEGLQAFFQTEPINSCCVLPLYHVSGLMQFLRSFLSGGKLTVLPFKTIERSAVPVCLSAETQFDPADFFLSLVPTQLQRLLTNSATVEWLKRFQVIFLGGAPAWPELLETARQQQLPIALTYGMTETAAQVVTLKPELFLRGSNGSGQVLPHAAIKICEHGQPLARRQFGTVTIQSKSLSLGYFSIGAQVEQFLTDEFLTDDLGYFDAEGILHIVGRNSQKIITGGENVFPAEVEAALRATGLVNDVCVVGMPDQTWGEVVTAVYVPVSSTVSSSTLKSALTPRLSSFKHPKQWVAVEQLPRNAQGKINIASLKQFL